MSVFNSFKVLLYKNNRDLLMIVVFCKQHTQTCFIVRIKMLLRQHTDKNIFLVSKLMGLK